MFDWLEEEIIILSPTLSLLTVHCVIICCLRWLQLAMKLFGATSIGQKSLSVNVIKNIILYRLMHDALTDCKVIFSFSFDTFLRLFWHDFMTFRPLKRPKFGNFPGLRPGPPGGLTAPPRPPAACRTSFARSIRRLAALGFHKTYINPVSAPGGWPIL